MSESAALEALFPRPRRLLLCAIYQEPERWWALAELAGRAGMHTTSLRQHLSVFRDGGLVRQKIDHGRAWFQADPACPIYAELQSIVRKLAARSDAETILIVEDQPATAQITRILLESWGYSVIEAHSGREALSLFDARNDGIQLLLTDVMMPEMSGPQLAAELRRRDPCLRVVFMSGYTDDHLNEPDAAFLPKPFNPASLSRMIRRELDRPLRQQKIQDQKSQMKSS